MRTSPLVLATLASAALCLFAGCKSDPEPAKAASGDTATDPSTPGEPSPSRAGSAPIPAGQDDGRTGVRQQKVDTLVTGFLDSARAALEKGDLASAHEALSHAYELEPSNEDVRILYDRVSLQMGERSTSVGDVARAAADQRRVRRAQAQLEINNKRTESRRLYELGDIDGAIQALEDAALILRWNPYLLGPTDDQGASEASLREQIANLRSKRDEVERERRAELERLALADKEEREREQRERTQNLIAQFLRKANDSFYVERYREAETFCNQVLDLDPENNEASQLKAIAADAFHATTERRYSADFKYHWREVFDELQYDNLPQTELITHPSISEWDRIKKRGPVRFSLEEVSVSPEDASINSIMDNQTIELNFDETDLVEAIDWFRVNTGINFIVDTIVRDDAATVAVSLSEMPVRKALELVLSLSTASMEIDYRVRNGVVEIVSAEDAVGGQVLEIYDVRDMTKPIPSFQSRDFNLLPSNIFLDDELEEIDPVPVVVAEDRLTELIQSNIDPDSWEADADNTITLTSGALVIRQSPEVHRKIRKLLSDLRKNAGTMIHIETRFLSLEDRFLEDIGVDWRGLDGQNGSADTASVPNVTLDDFGVPGAGGVGSPTNPEGIGTGNDAGAYYTRYGTMDLRGRLENLLDLSVGDEDFGGRGGLSLEWTYLDDIMTEVVLRAVQKSSQAEIIHAPSLTVFNGQRANIQNLEQVTYLKDFEVEIAQGAVVADPVIDVIRSGTVLDVRPVVTSDRRFITMEVRPTLAQLIEPIPVFVTSLAIGNEVEIELPELITQRIRTTVTIPDGSTLMLGGLKESIDTQAEAGLPWLNKIPFISFLFSRTATEKSRKKIMILLRGKIIVPEESEPF